MGLGVPTCNIRYVLNCTCEGTRSFMPYVVGFESAFSFVATVCRPCIALRSYLSMDCLSSLFRTATGLMEALVSWATTWSSRGQMS